MTFDEICLPDSNIVSINIEYDKAVITTYDSLNKYGYIITCTGLAGVTDLNIWDETIIYNASLKPVGLEDEFVKQCRDIYDWDYDTGINRKLSNGMLLLSIELANYVKFKVYCQKVEAEMYQGEEPK